MSKDTPKKTNDLLVELGLDSLPEEARDELYSEIGEVVFRGAMHRAWKVLDIKQQEALATLLEESAASPEDDKKQEAVDTYLQKYVPDFQRYIAEEVTALKKAQKNIVSEVT
jgi:hypothetical protein